MSIYELAEIANLRKLDARIKNAAESGYFSIEQIGLLEPEIVSFLESKRYSVSIREFDLPELAFTRDGGMQTVGIIRDNKTVISWTKDSLPLIPTKPSWFSNLFTKKTMKTVL